MSSPLEVIPIGGLGEFGMNCTVLRYGEDMVLVDLGVAFPEPQLGRLGIDLIVPNLEFVVENREQLRGILLTHGHEDHAGAVSYVIEELGVPIYGSALTLGLVEHRLAERGLLNQVELVTIEERQKIELGPFEVEPIHVTHSYPDSFAFAIATPVGTIIWTGDFKFDQTPVDGNPTDIARLSSYGEQGVLALFSDSTNSDRPGLAPPEWAVVDPLRALFRRAKRKIFITTFANSIHRIQVVLDLAQEFRRRVVPIGRSMLNNIRIAGELGYLDVPPDLVLTPGESRNHEPSSLVVLATGSQGEPMSALSRLAVNEFRKVEVEPDDMVILSSRIIPGNEKLIGNMVNHFYRRGARVFDSRHSQIHVSGHGHRADLKLMLNLTQPEFFVPIHGEYRQLQNHAALASEQGIPDDNIFVIESGQVLELDDSGAGLGGTVSVGRRLIDVGVRDEVDELVVRDRRYMSEDGFVLVLIQMDRSSGETLGDPEVVSRGFVQMDEREDLSDELLDRIEGVIADTPVEEKRDEELFKEILVKEVRRFLRKRTGKRPLIIPVMLET